MPNFQSYLQQIKASIAETTSPQLRSQPPQLLIDVREGEEYQEGDHVGCGFSLAY